MLRTMITATNTMSQLQQHLDIIGNNLANSATTGFKARDVKFHELLYQQFNNDKLDKTPRQSPIGIRYGVGAVLGQAEMNWKQGGLQQTQRDLDFAFTTAKQYFNILMPDDTNGTRTVYTRQGAFYVSPMENGQLMLVNGDGYSVADEDGAPIVFDENPSSFSMSDGGVLNVNYPDGTSDQTQLGVTVLQKPQLMEHISAAYIGLPNNLNELGVVEQDVLTDLQGADRDEIALQNGSLEMSNVNMSKEFTELINTQRSYQFNARAVTMADQMLGLINGIR
jgi:flagellar basal-body rod protein FlgG